jgi:hypothetical protein
MLLFFFSTKHLFFNLLAKIAAGYPDSLGTNYVPDYQIGYIFMANIIASFLTFLAL